MGFYHSYLVCVQIYARLSGPLHKMPQVPNLDGRKGSKKKLTWTQEAEEAFETLKRLLLENLGSFVSDPDKIFALPTDASDYAVGAVLARVRGDGSRVSMALSQWL